MFKRNPLFMCFQNGEDQPDDETESKEETISIDVHAAQSEKNGGHNEGLGVTSYRL